MFGSMCNPYRWLHVRAFAGIPLIGRSQGDLLNCKARDRENTRGENVSIYVCHGARSVFTLFVDSNLQVAGMRLQANT